MTSSEVTWIAGDDHGLVWPDGLALVDGRLKLTVAEQLWTVMSGGSDLAGFLDGLSSACGGLLAIPDFAIGLRLADGVHFAVRGDFRVRAKGAAGEAVDISGGEAVTWSERLIPGTLAFVLSGPAETEGVARPLASGVVPAGLLTSGRYAEDDSPGSPDVAVGEEPAADRSEDAPIGRASHEVTADGLVVGFPRNEDPGLTAVPDDLGVTRVPEPDLVTLLPDEPVGGATPAGAPRQVAIPGTFDDLWGATVARSVEEAAVRIAEDEHASGAGAAPLVGDESGDPGSPASSGGDGAWWRSASGLITGVPSGLGLSAGVAGIPHGRHGDHDGETIARAGLESSLMTGANPTPRGHEGFGRPETPGASGAADVPAVYCTLGHPNPPQSTACRICREAIPAGASRRIAQPVVGRVRASTGVSCELIGVVVVGRKPSGARVRGAGMPQLLVISGYPHVSSNHLEIRVDGWAVFARDLGSLNGTFLRRRGEQPSKLTEPIPIYNGDLLDLGHGASVTFEELP